MPRRPPRPPNAPQDDAAQDDVRERYRTASGQFRSRDFRKPQLSAEIDDPLDNRTRRSSAQRPAAMLDPTELYAAEHSHPAQGQGAQPGHRAHAHGPAGQSGPQVVQGARRASSVIPAAAMEAADTTVVEDAGPAHDAAEARARGLVPSHAVPWSAIGVVSLVLLGGALALPLTADGPGLWQALGSAELGTWAMGAKIAAGALTLALVVAVVAAVQGALQSGLGESALPSFALMGSAGLAVGSLILRAAAAPGSLDAPLAPMRGHLGGVPTAVWLGLAGGGLLALHEQQGQRLARGVVVAAGGALLFALWTPLGVAGESFVPLFTALSGSSAPEAGALLTGAWLDHPMAVILLSLSPALALTPVLLPSAPSALLARGLGVILLLLAPIEAVLCTGATGQAALGALLAAGGTAGLVACAAGLTVDRLRTRWDDEALVQGELLAVALVLAVFALAKINGMRYSSTDENVYFYAAKAWASGIWPYHDFFFSHPPLHIGLPALLFAAFGFSFGVAKALSALAAAIAGIFVWRIGRRWFDPISGVIAMVLFLFAGEVLKSSTNLTGINLTTMWACAGLWATLRRRSFLAGTLLGAAACTGFYSIGYFLTLTVLALFAPDFESDKRRPMLDRVIGQSGVQLLLGFALVFGAINLVFFLLAGEDYLTGVYRYHFLKRAKLAGFTPLDEGLHAIPSNLMLMLGGHDFRVSLYYHGAHFVLAFLAPLGLVALLLIRRHGQGVRPRTPPKGLPEHLADRGRWSMLWDPRMWWMWRREGGALALLIVLMWAMLTEFAQFKERYDFYYTLVLPLVSLVAAGWIHALMHLGRFAAGCGHSWSRPREGPEARGLMVKAPALAAPAFVVAMLLTLCWVPVNLWANATAWPSEIAARGSSKGKGERLSFEWVDTPGPKVLSDATKALLWKDSRVRGSLEAGLHHYLWSKKRWFSTAEAIATYIKEHSSGEDTITGSSTHAPLIALLSERRMAADHVDTNSKTFKTGVVSRKDFWTRACKDRVHFIVAGPRSYFSPRSMPRRPTVSRHFKLVKEFRDDKLKHWRSVTLQLWQRRQDPAKHVCTYEGPQQRRARGGRKGRAGRRRGR